MVNNLHRVLVAVILLSAILIANLAEAEEDTGGPPSMDPDEARPGLLAEPLRDPNSDSRLDMNYNEIYPGLLGRMRDLLSTPRQLLRTGVNVFLKTFLNQCLPCTLWSVFPLHIKCEDRCD